MIFAFSMNASEPSLRLIELTMHLPWAFFSPAKMVSQCDESIIRAALATAGSLDIYLTKRSISLVLSSIASSMLMSMMVAPSSICFAAIWSASSYLLSDMSLANLREPATLVLSPTFVKLLFRMSTVVVSRPLTVSTGLSSLKWAVFEDESPDLVLSSLKWAVFEDESPDLVFSSLKWAVFEDEKSGSWRGATSSRASAIARMWSGVVPQHPPTMFTSPFSAIAFTADAISSGLWSYPPISLGRPAFG